ncbi:hypothetical protein C8Q77DRAFT_1080158 [Trametes polyzona]|nr:hypothetical protein C8Q77DRAFT_1080158 [Trametes polyzona]
MARERAVRTETRRLRTRNEFLGQGARAHRHLCRRPRCEDLHRARTHSTRARGRVLALQGLQRGVRPRVRRAARLRQPAAHRDSPRPHLHAARDHLQAERGDRRRNRRLPQGGLPHGHEGAAPRPGTVEGQHGAAPVRVQRAHALGVPPPRGSAKSTDMESDPRVVLDLVLPQIGGRGGGAEPFALERAIVYHERVLAKVADESERYQLSGKIRIVEDRIRRHGDAVVKLVMGRIAKLAAGEDHFCRYCGKDGVETRCSKCKKAYFCPPCQALGWKYHKVWCS